MGGKLATAVGTAATATDGIEEVKKLMKEANVEDKEAEANAQAVYEAIQTFLENTDFTFKPGKKY